MPLTIVMYHYIRDVTEGPFSRLKTRSVGEFRRQLDYIAGNFRVVRMEDVLAAAAGAGRLPENAVLLTFDDGYREHYTTVASLLWERNWQGSFFAPAAPVLRRTMLDANKIHFVLATQPDPGGVLSFVKAAIDERRDEFHLPSAETLYARLALPSRFDSAEIVFIKRALQRDLPRPLRSAICSELFARFVSADERAFADDLYLSVDELSGLRESGMWIGAHGDTHEWLDRLDAAAQQREIDAGLLLLRQAGASTQEWTIAYPYGGYNEPLVNLVAQRGCRIGLSTRVAVADLACDAALTLPRLDTNDLPSAPGEKNSRSSECFQSGIRLGSSGEMAEAPWQGRTL